MKAKQQEEIIMEKYIVLQGYYDCYAVSNLGNVKNLRTGNILNPTVRKDGYKSVLLSRDGKKMSIRVHQLVAQYFIEKSQNKVEVNHKNGIKHDNRACNLEWVTKSENMIHAYENNLITTKYKNKNILVYDYNSGELLFIFQSVKQCSKFLGLNMSPIYRVLKGENNRHHNYSFKYANRI